LVEQIHTAICKQMQLKMQIKIIVGYILQTKDSSFSSIDAFFIEATLISITEKEKFLQTNWH